MIRCLGDYTYGDQDQKTYNILLEYGEVDLDEYFVATPPPALAPDIVVFWEDLFKVAEAVRDLHSFKFPRAGVEREYHGYANPPPRVDMTDNGRWHADIKPDNILRVCGSFKLADFGFASFKRMDEERALLRGGTVTYGKFDSLVFIRMSLKRCPTGAPECVRAQDSQTRVSQAIDIWSLGCVLSEAACWVVLGEPGIQQFGSLREQAIKSLSNEQLSRFSTDRELIRSSGRQFHNGTHVLKEVRQWHEHLRTVVRQTDVITERVLDLIDQHMLLDAPEHRYTASAVCDGLKDILVRAKRDLRPLHRTQSTKSALSYTTELRRHFDSVDVQPIALPQVSTRPLGSEPAIEQQDSQSPSFRSSGISQTRSALPEAPLLSLTDIAGLPQNNRLMMNRISFRGSDSALNSEDEWSQTPGPLSSPTLRENGAGPTAPELSNRSRFVPRFVVQSHPVLTLTIAEARKAIDRERKSSLFSRFKPKKGDEYLSKYIRNRDLVRLSPRPVLS